MRITCLGGAGGVTGSCYLIESGKKYLVDCGLFQGGAQTEAQNRAPWGFDPREIAALFLTHAHIDHSGRIPKLVRDGFRGPIHATAPTVELAKIMLLDSAHIQEMEAEWETRKNKRKASKPVEPLYTAADAQAAARLFSPVAPGGTVAVAENIRVRFRGAGHILGASILEVFGGPEADAPKVVFSGDLGRKDQLIVRDAQNVFAADALFIESTYGDRLHKSFEDSREELLSAIRYASGNGEKVVIPAFAVERTQELLYMLGEFFREGAIPAMPVYLDSPLAIAATGVFRRMKEYYDTETAEIAARSGDPFDFPGLVLSKTVEDSMAINRAQGPGIIIAGNGMCTGGRIKHHLKHNLWRPGAAVVIVGYQAAGSLGRRMVEGAKSVRIFGEDIAVKARLYTIGGFSAHADRDDLLEWVSHFENPRMAVYVIHGEPKASESLAAAIRERFGFTAHVPAPGERVVVGPEGAQAPEPAPPLEAPAPWETRIESLAAKADAVRALMRGAWAGLPRKLAEQLQTELAQAEEHLDVVVKRLRRRVR